MPKMKTSKAVAKRVKITARGKMLRNRPGAGHLKSKKSPSRLRRFRQTRKLSPGFTRQVRQMLGGKA